MPTYRFINKETGEEFEEFFKSYKNKDEYLNNNAHIEQLVGAPNIVSGVAGSKPDDGFRDILKNIKRRIPGSNVNTW